MIAHVRPVQHPVLPDRRTSVQCRPLDMCPRGFIECAVRDSRIHQGQVWMEKSKTCALSTKCWCLHQGHTRHEKRITLCAAILHGPRCFSKSASRDFCIHIKCAIETRQCDYLPCLELEASEKGLCSCAFRRFVVCAAQSSSTMRRAPLRSATSGNGRK